MKNNIQIPTLTMKDAERLSAPHPRRGGAVSFYLGIRADQNFLSVANSFLSEQAKAIEKSGDFSPVEQRSLAQVFAAMERDLRSRRLPDRTRTLVMFYPRRGAGRIYRLPVYVPTQLVVEEDWYVHPLLKSLEKYPRYAVTFLERDRARLFELFWGEIEQQTEEIRSEVPQRMNAARATWKGLEERKIQNHIEVHINRHLEKVAWATERLMDKHHLPYLVIASRRELIERFRAFLPKRLQDRIVGSYLTRSDQNLSRIREKSLEVVDRFEQMEEERWIDQLREGSSKKEKEAVLGTEAVLEHLYDYQVHVLVISKDFRAAGYVCPSDHHVGLSGENCPACDTDLDPATDIVDEIIETALSRQLKVVHFQFAHPAFDSYGLGAILK